MSLLDLLTGGKSSEASGDLEAALQDIRAVQAPTQADLTLPQLQEYVNAGLMTPAQAEAVLQGPNAYDTIQNDASTTEAEKTALNQLEQVAGDNGMTPEMEAQLTAALNKANTNTQGERGSILDAMAQRGIPTSLMGTAAQEAAAGQDAQTANLESAQAAGQAEQNALTAMANAGTLAGNINQQEYTQQANKAAAQNAINNWNAENQTNVNLQNANLKQQANAYNTENAQDVANKNTGLANERTQYNAQVPETVFNNAMQKAGAEAGVSEQQANQATGQGEQTAGLYSGILGGISQMAAAGLSGGASAAGGAAGAALPAITDAVAGAAAAKGGEVHGGSRPRITRTHDGGVEVAPPYMADSGGQVPGRPRVPGDSIKNDRVHALLSPGEVVLPRTVSQAPNAPDRAKQFMNALLRGPRPVKPMHPEDLHSMMEALSRRRETAA